MRTILVSSFDEQYFKYARVSVSTLEQNLDRPMELICLVPQKDVGRLSEFTYGLGLEKLSVKFKSSGLYNGGSLEKYPAQEYLTANMNHRVVMQDLLEGYDRAIYFDPDTLFVRSVAPILDYPMYNKLIAVQENLGQAEHSFGTIDIPYFNNGFFIADMNFWREFGAQDKMVQYLKDNPSARCPDQDAMNFVFREHWCPAPFSFNSFNYIYWQEHLVSQSNWQPIMVHFVGPDKPWDTQRTKWANLWKEHFETISGV